MVQPKKYLVQCFFSLIILSVAYYAFFTLQFDNPSAAEYWIHDELVVKKHFVENIKKPKIMIVSGSNALFGIDSAYLEKTLQRPVQNLSVHAGLPLDSLFTYVAPIAKKGDIIILPLEWEYYQNDFLQPSEWMIQQVAAWNKAYFDTLPFLRKLIYIQAESLNDVVQFISLNHHKQAILKTNPERARRSESVLLAEYNAKAPLTHFAFDYLNTNKKGDMLNTCGKTYLNLTKDQFSLSTLHYINFIKLKIELNKLEKRGVQTFVTFPALPRMLVTTDDYKKMQQIVSLLKNLHINVIGKPENYFYSNDDFYNSYYHLNCLGKMKRSRRLGMQMQDALVNSNHYQWEDPLALSILFIKNRNGLG